MMKEAPVVEVAKIHNDSPATILLSYHVARGSSVLAKSVTPDRIKSNMEIVKLSDSDMKILTDYSKELEKNGKLVRYVYPQFGVKFGFPDKG